MRALFCRLLLCRFACSIWPGRVGTALLEILDAFTCLFQLMYRGRILSG